MSMTEDQAARFVRAVFDQMRKVIPAELKDFHLEILAARNGTALWADPGSIEANYRTCQTCNLGGHTCPGCGADVDHGHVACRKCGPAEYGDPPWADEPNGPVVAREWSAVAEGDWVQGGDRAFYLVQGNRAENGKAYVTILVRGKANTYPREPEVFAQVKRGPTGLAVDTLAEAFDLAVIESA